MAHKAHIRQAVRSELVLNSIGECFNPECDEPLIVDRDGRPQLNYEIAHIRDENPPTSEGADIGWRYYSQVGERGNRNEYSNLILLCGPCHRLVDKTDPRKFTVAVLQEWKSQAEALARARLSPVDMAVADDAHLSNIGRFVPLPVRDRFFYGRESVLLDIRLLAEDPEVRSIGLLGQGGIGKSSIATEFGWRQLDGLSLVRWINGHSRSALVEGLLDLGRVVGLDSQGVSLDDSLAAVKRALELHVEPWLLVIDGADEDMSVASFLPKSGSGTVLVTTRNRQVAARCDAQVEVEAPDRETAALLIRSVADVEPVDADRLAKRVQDVPLALRQVAALVAFVGLTPDEVLSELDRSAAEVFGGNDAHIFHPDGRDMVVLTCWTASVAHAEMRSAGARWLCELVSVLAPEPIPMNLLLHLAESRFASQLAARRSLRALADLSVLRVDNSQGVVVINALVQETVRINATGPDVTYREAILAAATWAESNLMDGSDPAVADVAGHLAALLFGGSAVSLQAVEGRRSLAELLCSHYRNRGLLEESQIAGEMALAVATDEEVAGAAAELSATLLDRNDLQAASLILSLEEAPPARSSDEGSLAYHFRLVQLLREKGDYVAAAGHAQLVAGSVEASLPETHPIAMGLANQVAICDWDAGAPEVAAPLFDRLAVLHASQYGDGHIDGLIFRMNAAACKFEAGEIEKALSEERSLVRDFEEYFGRDHPMALMAIANLAVSLAADGPSGVERSMTLDAEVLTRRSRVLGPIHRDTLDSQLNLGDSYLATGDFESAEPLLRTAVEGYTTVLPEWHMRILVARKTLAECLIRSGQVDEGFSTLIEVEQGLRDEHPKNLREIESVLALIAELS